jgi:hypothetical protein
VAATGDSSRGVLGIAGALFAAFVLIVFASYFFYTMQNVTTITTVTANVTQVPYATSGPFGVSGLNTIMNYTGNIINTPLAVAALIFLGFIMLALYGRARSNR